MSFRYNILAFENSWVFMKLSFRTSLVLVLLFRMNNNWCLELICRVNFGQLCFWGTSLDISFLDIVSDFLKKLFVIWCNYSWLNHCYIFLFLIFRILAFIFILNGFVRIPFLTIDKIIFDIDNFRFNLFFVGFNLFHYITKILHYFLCY